MSSLSSFSNSVEKEKKKIILFITIQKREESELLKWQVVLLDIQLVNTIEYTIDASRVCRKRKCR